MWFYSCFQSNCSSHKQSSVVLHYISSLCLNKRGHILSQQTLCSINWLQAIAAIMANVKFADVIKMFDGSTDCANWLQKLELVASLQGVKRLEKFVPLFLEGGAFAVYTSIHEDDKQNYEKVKAVLLQAFSVDPCHAYEEFRARKMLPGESVDVFLVDLNRLARLIDKYASDAWIKCAFIAGLQEDVRVQLHAACSLNKMELAETVERARNLTKVKTKDLCMVGVTNKVEDRHREGCFNCGKKGHVSRECRADTRQRRRCFVCNDPRHLASSCPMRSTNYIPKNV